MRKLFTQFPGKRLMLAAVALLTAASSAFAGGDEWYAYKVQVDAYPTGAGTVYVTDDMFAEPEASDFAATQDFELTTTGFSIYGYAQAAEGWQFIGFAKDLVDEEGNVTRVDEVAAAISEGDAYAWLSLDNGVGSKHFDEDTQTEVSDDSTTVAALMPLDPNNYFRALFTHVAVRVNERNTSMGDVEIDKLVNDIGDQVTVTATPASEFNAFTGWTLDGQLVSTEPTLTVDVTGVATYEATFSDTRSITIHFPEEGGYYEFYSPYAYNLFYEAEAYSAGITEGYENDLVAQDGEGTTYLTVITSGYGTAGKAATILYGAGDVTIHPQSAEEDYDPFSPQLLQWSGDEGVNIADLSQENDKYYTFDATTGIFTLATEGRVEAGHVYMQLPDSLVAGFASTPEKIYINEEVATGIAAVRTSLTNGQLRRGIYTLDGRRLSAINREGIYVFDGKKVIYKK